jgi:hypothetical protein
MKRLVLSIVVAVGVALSIVSMRAQSSSVQVDRLRFRVMSDEPVATADLRNTVTGWRVVVLKDTHTDQCFITFLTASTVSKTDPVACP